MTLLLMSLVLVLVSFYFLFLGAKVLISKRPLLMPAKYNFFVLVLVFGMQLVMPIKNLFVMREFESDTTNWIMYATPLFTIVLYSGLLYYFWKILKGFTVIGVTEDAFRNSLKDALASLRLPYEERLSKMHLESLGVDLQSSVGAWAGVASIKIKEPGYEEVEKQIADALQNELSRSEEPLNLNSIYFYLGTGSLLIAFSAMFTYWIWTTESFWRNFNY